MSEHMSIWAWGIFLASQKSTMALCFLRMATVDVTVVM